MGGQVGVGEGSTFEPRYPRPPVGQQQAERVWRLLADEAAHDPADPEVVRLACAAVLARAARARHGELAGLLLSGLNLRHGTLRLLRFPQRRTVSPPVLELHYLDDPAIAVCRRWLKVRRGLVAANVTGGDVQHVFVTVRASTTRDGATKPPGLPIHVNGLLTSWGRQMHRLNVRHAGEDGWEPLPTRFEQYRRAW